ncbi:MAG: lipopolysaccharide heptosyltransferase II [Acidobacteriota bacterium]|nr:lipopolysaccharide heptosyltransferase II [Blastocatellia bacterium]MDW8411743.1 lipopolysaccharide heptosyltransferase II [Acidobacteriota bacterium]
MISKLLVRGTNWVGDSVITIPALRELRRIFAKAHISLLVKPWVSGLFTDADFVDEVIVYDREKKGLLKTIKELRRLKFDLAVLFQNAFEAALIAYCCRIPLRIGFATQHRSILLTHALELTEEIRRSHQVNYYLHIVAQTERLLTGVSTVDFARPNCYLPVSEERRRQLLERLPMLGVNLDKPIVAINAGATNSRAKRWPAERFGQLADRLFERGLEVVFIGAATEIEITRAATTAMRNKPKILTGKTSLAESIAFLSFCRAVVSNDTGPAYLAAAMNIPTLTIFGPTDERSIRPLGANAEILRRKVPCAPCMLKICPIDHRCMITISVDDVEKKVLEML